MQQSGSTVKNAEHRRIDAFQLWWWRRLLRVPWTARRSNQSILKEISSGCSLEELTLKLKLQYFVHLMRRVDSLEKSLMLAGIEGRRRRGRERMRWLDGITTWWTWIWVNSGRWWWTGRPGVLRFTGSQRVGHDWATELNWTESITYQEYYRLCFCTIADKVTEVKYCDTVREVQLWNPALSFHIFIEPF